MSAFLGFIIFSIFSAQAAQACLPQIAGLNSKYLYKDTGEGNLCRLADRYQRAKNSLAQQNIPAQHIADLRAPRFIFVADWERQKQRIGEAVGAYDPRFTYDRPGQTPGSAWAGWSRAATMVDTKAATYFEQLKNNSFQSMDLSARFFQSLHAAALATTEPDLAGVIRQRQAYGTSLYRATAPSLLDITAARANSYVNLGPNGQVIGRNLVRWENTLCLEDMSEAERNRILTELRVFNVDLLRIQNSPFVDSSGIQRQCGYYVYASAGQIGAQFNLLQQDINSMIQRRADPLLIASRIQRWFVSIHPFGGGNGRTSRLLMDYVAQSFGLPAPILNYVDADLTKSEEAWAAKIAEGIEKAVIMTESCAKDSIQLKCILVPGAF